MSQSDERVRCLDQVQNGMLYLYSDGKDKKETILKVVEGNNKGFKAIKVGEDSPPVNINWVEFVLSDDQLYFYKAG